MSHDKQMHCGPVALSNTVSTETRLAHGHAPTWRLTCYRTVIGNGMDSTTIIQSENLRAELFKLYE